MSLPLIMLVEDDSEIRHLLEEIFAVDSGWSTRAFSSCDNALQAIEEGLRPDVIVFDVRMPGKNGNDLLCYRNERFPSVPAIAITASPGSLTVRGATAVLTKPFSPKKLVGLIERALAGDSSGVPT